ncbi:hypothetical protein K505DRAFT_358479 [Melanomma pulvis-pyrius CBS 109.77]|uniref:Uncharacterized protein n=1 Tax=Melanomma pulvis-pyrius CBS 109.77 TaxID=1314802 RepID=A0A6A6XM92_9PLEO|nr:hypothetical protein K505DRAFT_358479 [Melanomma pulvis-pyrius CBS 109.77]
MDFSHDSSPKSPPDIHPVSSSASPSVSPSHSSHLSSPRGPVPLTQPTPESQFTPRSPPSQRRPDAEVPRWMMRRTIRVRRVWDFISPFVCYISIALFRVTILLSVICIILYSIYSGALIALNRQDWSSVDDHVLTENFPAACPPNYRYYHISYERVLGMPAPLYAHLHPPRHLVKKYYRQSLKCWHDDKRSLYPHLTNQQWKEIKLIIEDSKDKLLMGDYDPTYPRYINSPTRNTFEWVEESEVWNRRVSTPSVALYKSNCTCTAPKALEQWLEPPEMKPLPQTEEQIKCYCPCNFEILAKTYQWFWRNNLPPLCGHEFFYATGRLQRYRYPFDAFLYILGNRFLLPFRLRDCSQTDQQTLYRLVKEEWYDITDFESEIKKFSSVGGPLVDLWKEINARQAEESKERVRVMLKNEGIMMEWFLKHQRELKASWLKGGYLQLFGRRFYF